MKNDSKPKSDLFNSTMDGAALVEMLDRRINASKEYWDKEYKLEKVTKENEKYYLGRQVSDQDDDYYENGPPSLDNRIFSSVRTIVPYVTTRITEPEVYPSSNSQAAKKFAEDYEKALFVFAEEENTKDKMKFALEDGIIRRRGYLKFRYDGVRKKFATIEFVPAESIVIDHKARKYEEPRYFRHYLEKSIEDLLTMFPDIQEKIYETFGIDPKSATKQALEEEHTINEDWVFVPDPEEGLDLLVCWNYKGMPLGTMRDPNWRYGKSNMLEYHMMPLVFVNVLSDGRTYIDKTSFVEQAKYLQMNVDERSQQISQNAGYGNTGMPVVDSAALAEDQSKNLTFEPDTVLELDVKNAGADSINDVFTTWKSGTLPNFVYDDKLDSRNGIDNAFGTPNVFRGEQSKNNTLGQDVLVRDQAFGRQQEIVDSIDAAMSRLYLLAAQFMLVYGDEEMLFRFMGEDGEFDYVLMNSGDLDTNVQIRVKSGTSMPIDRAQRRATADAAANHGMIDPLTYWEIMDEGNAEKYAKRLMDYQTDPASFLKDTEADVFNRDAFVDIDIIKKGGEPPFREDLPKEYFDHLNRYILSGDMDNPENMGVKDAMTAFIDAQLARGQKMLGMAETQLPTPEEVMGQNEQTDQLNQADQQAADQLAKQQPQGPQPTINAPQQGKIPM